jgi:hypothetical protein
MYLKVWCEGRERNLWLILLLEHMVALGMFEYLILYSCTNFDIPLKSTFVCTIYIPQSFSTSSLTTNAIGIFFYFLPNLKCSKDFFFTSLALGWISTTLLISIVIKLLFNPLLILNYKLSKKCWNSCNKLSPWCDMLSLELQGFTIWLQCKVMQYLPLPCCFTTFGGKMPYMNFGRKVFNGFTWFLIQWSKVVLIVLMELFFVCDLF